MAAVSEDAKIVILSEARSAKSKGLHFASVASLFPVVKSPTIHDVILNEVKDLRFAS